MRRHLLLTVIFLAAAARAAVFDLGGETVTLHVTNVLKTAAVLTNGTFVATNGQSFAQFPTGTVTVAAGARLVFPDDLSRNYLRVDRPGDCRMLLDGGTWEVFSHRDQDNYSHYWGYGGDPNVRPVLEVCRDGLFHLGLPGGAMSNGPVANRHYFTLGYYGGKVPQATLLGNDAPHGGFRFDGRIYIGLSAYGVVACTNCAFRAENIVFGSLGVINGRTGGLALLSFAGGSEVTTKGFVQGDNGTEAEVVFDDAVVRALPTEPGDAVNAQTNFFGAADYVPTYWIEPGGLAFDNNGLDVTIAKELYGEGPLFLSGTGTTRITRDQPFTGALVVGPSLAFRPARNLVFAAPVVITDEAALERPPLPAGHNHVRLFSAPAFYGLTGRKDAAHRYFFTLPGRYGRELHWGKTPGTEVRVR